MKAVILVKTVKTFSKTHQSYVNDIDIKSSKITLAENNIAVADKKSLVELMHNYFINITKNLNPKNPVINTTGDTQSPRKNYENYVQVYPKIVPDPFYFRLVSLDGVKKLVLNLNLIKPSASRTIH